MKIKWSPLSIQRIQEIADYIADDNISAARNWIDKIFQRVDILKSNPEFRRPDISEIIFGNYRIIYFVARKEIAIVTIRHFKQILPKSEIGL